MVKEERSLRTRLAAGSKRRIARRIKRRFRLQASHADLRAIAVCGKAEALTADYEHEEDRNVRLKCLARFEADSMPTYSSIFSILVRPPHPRVEPSSSASAAH